jgi:ABC-2 type transport system permease protein
MILALFTKTWRDRWRGLAAWTIGLMAIASVQLWVYPSIRDSAEGITEMLSGYPDAFKQMFRMDDYTSGSGFLNVELFSFMVPLIFIAVGVNWGAGATADEEHKGTADILLTLPVSRTAVIVTKMASTASVLAALCVALTATLIVGTGLVGIHIASTNLFAASAACALLGMLYAAIGFLIGALVGRPGIATGVGIALGLATFLFYSLAPLVDTFDAISPINPFQWALGNDPLTNGLALSSICWLIATCAVFLAASVLAFKRRDIST